jgi:hypothetical protein
LATSTRALAALALVACASRPPTPQREAPVVVSFASDATAFWAAAKDKPPEEQLVLWDRLVERPHAAFYDQVVWETAKHPDAAERRQRLLRRRFAEEAVIADDLPRRFHELEDIARRQVPRFRARFADMPTDVPIFAALSPTFDAKGAVLASPEPQIVLAFGVDTIALYHENLDIIFPHELFHVYHAKVSGFLNDGVMPGVDLVIPLWEEGLATYVSSLFEPDAKDGALLLQDELGWVPAEEIPALARGFLRDANAKAVDREAFARWFSAGVPSVTPTTPNRAGYLLGLHVARRLARTTSLVDMVHWRAPAAHERVLAALREIAKGEG